MEEHKNLRPRDVSNFHVLYRFRIEAGPRVWFTNDAFEAETKALRLGRHNPLVTMTDHERFRRATPGGVYCWRVTSTPAWDGRLEFELDDFGAHPG